MEGEDMNAASSHDRQHAAGCGCEQPCTPCACRKPDAGRRTKPVLWLLGLFGILVLLAAGAPAYGATDPKHTEEPGLLIIAHGSPARAWNQAVLAQEQKVRDLLGQDSPFAGVKIVLMEFGEPNVADGVEELQQAGCPRIVVVPLMIAPSPHSHWDIPALLGLYSDPKVERDLKEEGARVVRNRVPLTLTATLADSDVIERVMLKRVRALSSDPNAEALVVLSHGSEEMPTAWEDLMKRTAAYICGKTGITYADWACPAVGQEYSRAAKAIQKAAEHRERVIVVGTYLSMGVGRMHKQWTDRSDKQNAEMPGSENPLKGLNILLAEQGLLPDELVAQWIVATARDEIARHP
jgi:sirohydrochlorin ferrochelatase